MPEKKHYSEKGGHFKRRQYDFAQRLRERYFPGLYFRTIPAPVIISNEQSSWVRRVRQPRYN